MGRDELFQRVLGAFRDTEADFVAAVELALAERRGGDALRRAHDMKGLAGALGAHALQAAAQALNAALEAQQAAGGRRELVQVSVELDRVLQQIDTLVPRGPSPQPSPQRGEGAKTLDP